MGGIIECICIGGGDNGGTVSQASIVDLSVVIVEADTCPSLRLHVFGTDTLIRILIPDKSLNARTFVVPYTDPSRKCNLSAVKYTPSRLCIPTPVVGAVTFIDTWPIEQGVLYLSAINHAFS